MKTLLIALGTAALLPATAAMAQEVQFGAIQDKNSDGYYSYEEINGQFPGATRAAVDRADTNGDGFVDANELQNAIFNRYFVG
jgi:hypothetical protein